MNQKQKEQLAEFLNRVFSITETDYEEVINLHGVESEEAEGHIYALARDLWATHELDYS